MTLVKKIFPAFRMESEVEAYLHSTPQLWNRFMRLPENIREILIGYFMGRNGLPVTFDTVFQMVFDPEKHPERLEGLLSAIFGQKVKIVQLLKREGTMLTERGSFVVMDVVVILDSGVYADIEMQKIGYKFPIERSDCYAADLIMRQYSRLKDKLGKKFSFKKLQKVFCIVLMEQSPAAFKAVPGVYAHHRSMWFDTDIMAGETGLHEDFFLCLDMFRENAHNNHNMIDKSSNMRDVWLTFLSATDKGEIMNLITEYPEFLPIYEEMAEFAMNPEVLMDMFSQELYIMDKNMERMMVTELQEEVTGLQGEVAGLQGEVVGLQKEVAQRDVVIAEKDEALAEKDGVIAEKDEALAEKDGVIAEKDEALAEKDGVIVEKDNTIIEQGRIIAELQAKLAKIQQ